MSDERGQALVVGVLLLALAAVMLSGLRLSQDRLLAVERARRAGEAAAEAATSAVADVYVTELRRVAAATPPRPEVDAQRIAADASTVATARAAASSLSAVNGGPEPEDVRVRCANGRFEITVTSAGVAYRAGFPAAECSRR